VRVAVQHIGAVAAIQRVVAIATMQVIGIGIDSASNIGQFSRKTPMRYPLVVAGNSGLELVRRLGNTAGALPFTVVLARDGSVTWRTLGRFKTADLRQAIERVL